MRVLFVLFLIGSPAWADGAQVPRSQRVRSGLLAPDRDARERAAVLARQWARTDPAAVDALYSDLDLRGRVALVRALAGAGTRHGATLALGHANDPEEAVFRSIVAGLGEGGERAIFADPPKGLVLPKARQQALDDLQLRWRVEAEFAALKSRSGRTGHYTGQYAKLAKLRPGVIDVMWHIVRDRSWPQPGEASGEHYRPLHPGMLDFDEEERRTLAAYSFGELITDDDNVWKRRVLRLFDEYWRLDADKPRSEKTHPIEKDVIAPALAYSLHDLGLRRPASLYIAELRTLARRMDFDGLQAMWDLGYAYMRIGDFVQGERWYKRVIELQDDWGRGVACYNLACHFAVRAGKEPRNAAHYKRMALQWLEDSILRHNFIDWVWMEEDGDLNSIRNEPRYRALRDRLKNKYPEPPRRKKKIEKDPEKFLKPEKKK
ncbi:MAG: hypothetical protein ACYTGZ_18725 [Planctomycetota bacterium]|jgi:hypothetical protein